MGGDEIRAALVAQGVSTPEDCTIGQLIAMSKRAATGNCHGVLFSTNSPECKKCLDRILCTERCSDLWETKYSDTGVQLAAPVKTVIEPTPDNKDCVIGGFKEFSKLPAEATKATKALPTLDGVLPEDIKMKPGTKTHTVALLFFKHDTGVSFMKRSFLEETFAFFGTSKSLPQIVHSVSAKLQDRGYLEILPDKKYLLLKK